MGRWGNAVRLFLKLGRMKMTVFSAVTYATASSVATPSEFDTGLFISGWAFVFCSQLVAHFLGEYYDLPSDKLNWYAGPLTGGSRVLVTGEVSPGQCFALGYAFFAAALAILAWALPPRCWLLGCVMLFIAHQYSATPFKLNHRGLGELGASAATNLLLPQFAALAQSTAYETPLGSLAFHSSLAVLVLPSFFLKVGLFVILNMADRRPDWLGGKKTLPVLLGEEISARIVGACTILAYASAIAVFLVGLCPATTLVAVLVSAPEALSISRAFNPSLTLPQVLGGETASDGGMNNRRPYRLESLVVRALKHAPSVVIAVFLDTVLREVFVAGTAAVAVANTESTGSVWDLSVGVLISVGTALLSTSLPVRCLPMLPFVYLFFVRGPPPPKAAAGAATSAGTAGIVVAGGGVGGLVFGACLQQLGLPFQILDKNVAEDDAGADTALWPAATKILKELGVGSSNSVDGEFVDGLDFWEQKTYPVRRVRLCKVDRLAQGKSSSPAVSSKSADGKDNASRVALTAVTDTVLAEVDMDAVVAGEEEPFRLVRRTALMSVLLPLVEGVKLRRGVRVIRAEQSLPPAPPSAIAHVTNATDVAGAVSPGNRHTCRVLVGADGIHSVCRHEVFSNIAAVSSSAPCDGTVLPPPPTATRAMGARDGGEVCYRGVLDLREGLAATKAGLREVFEEDEKKRPSSMSVVYGDRIRFSWGFLDGARESGYWFVKQLTKKGDGGGGAATADDGGESDGERSSPSIGQHWPEPLRTFAKMTPNNCSYAHPIQDRPPLDRWSCSNITLLGDACHAATPNNGQGACMAIEDALVLATLLAEYWDQPDGHVEAFYQYERARSAHTRRVQGESLKQMKLGQLTSRVGIWARELAIRSIPPSVFQKKLRAANVFDIDGWLDRFRKLKAERGCKKGGS